MSHDWSPGGRLDHALSLLRSLAGGDADPWNPRMFTHAYNPGLGDLLDATWEAYRLYRDKTMLDFTVYPSLVTLEREVVGFVGEIAHAPDGYSGAFTYGGTESIILSALAAREEWRRRGGTGTPKIVLPETGHPAFDKAAYLLGMKTVRVQVDRESWTVEPARLAEHVDDETAMVVASAVNYPFGTMDSVHEIAEELEGRAWLHVDACLGGMVLGFLGDRIPPWDFRVEGVQSISVDLHKYGYAPKGASVALFREARLRKPTIFVHTDWPGYPLVNQALLSTRSAAPLAASWLIIKALGVEGYRVLVERIVEAREGIVRGAREIGLEVAGTPVAGTVAIYSMDKDVFALNRGLRARGWIVQLQPGNRERGWPTSLHLTISPVHHQVVDEFLSDLAEAYEEAPTGFREPSLEEVMEWIAREGLTGEVLDAIDRLFYAYPPEMAQELVREALPEIFRPEAPRHG